MQKTGSPFARNPFLKWLIPLGALVIVLMVASAVLVRNLVPQKIVVATDPTWPPFEYKDEATQQIVGFDIDLMDAIAGKANLEVEYVGMGFDQIMDSLAECKVDAAVSFVAVTGERDERVAYSDAYYQLGQQLIVRADNTDIQGAGNLAGKKVGAEIGTDAARETGKIDGVQLIAYDGVFQALAALERGELDAVALDNMLAPGVAGSGGGKYKLVGEVFAGRDVAIAVCKKDAGLLNKINKALAAIKAEGQLDPLISKWLSAPA